MIATYVTMNEQSVYINGSQKILPPNSFVKPIEPKWLPAHIKENYNFKTFDYEENVFVYCHYGIVMIPRSNIRSV